MKRYLILILLPIFLNSCYFIIQQEPTFKPGGETTGQIHEPSNNNSKNNNNGSNNKNDDNNEDNDGITTNPTPHENEEPPVSTFVPEHKWDSCTINGILTFNVYLGWDFNEKETIAYIADFPKNGGYILFNIYPNNLSMSMYGFEKFNTSFYYFSSEEPYSGYGSYSLDTQYKAQYLMCVQKNNTTSTRRCIGYWSANDCYSFYSAFKIALYQTF